MDHLVENSKPCSEILLVEAIDTAAVGRRDESPSAIDDQYFLPHQLMLGDSGEDVFSQFPVEIYPPRLQDIIERWVDGLQFPVNFIAASLLPVMASCIGNHYRVSPKTGHIEPLVFYVCLVGHPGQMKTPVMNHVVKPIEKRDIDAIKRAVQEIEGDRTGNSGQVLIQTHSLAGIRHAHVKNPKGLLVNVDEVMSIVKLWGVRGDTIQEQWLTWYSGGAMKNNLKQGSTTLPYTSINLLTGIQTNRIGELLSKEFRSNGGAERFMVVFSDEPAPYFNDSSNVEVADKDWDAFLCKLLDLPFGEGDEPQILMFCREAKDTYGSWQNGIVDQINAAPDDPRSSMLSKLRMVVVRLAGLLQLVWDSCEGIISEQISRKSVERAILAGSFLLSHHDYAMDKTLPPDQLSRHQDILFSKLPNSFTTKEALEIAEICNLGCDRSVKRYLKDSSRYRKTRHGSYQKVNEHKHF